ncbi:alpha/beta hydrolase [uncultured Victivallis sp.]|uniref:alpha/beta hydrolase n=1 Tax=uncultured Victivallis sp. TaxID=354118 RepID=UPI0025F88AA4|nr:alpha/beta hydrolase [uncultured Victivallis sp.]
MKNEWKDFRIPNAAAYRPVRRADFGGRGLEEQSLYISVPIGEGPHPVAVWFHGGGLTAGGQEVPDCLYDGRLIVIEARYRLSPAYPAPAALEDAAAAVAWAMIHAEEFDIDQGRLFVGGMSAGAWLAAMVGMDGSRLARHGFDHRKLAGLFPISGQMTTHFRFKEDLHYPQSQFEPVIDRYAPLGHLCADLPPILLVTGESGLDMPGRPEENALMAASLKALGHPLVRCVHLKGCDHGAALDNCGPALTAFLDELLEGKR